MVSLFKLVICYLNLTTTVSGEESYSLKGDYNANASSLQYHYKPKATPTKGIIKLSLSPNELTSTGIIVSTPFPYRKKASFSTNDQVILFNEYTSPKDRMSVTNFKWELTSLQVQFKTIISFEYPITTHSLSSFRNKIKAFLHRYEPHILQNNQTDPQTIRNLFNAVLLWDKTTVLKSLLKSNEFNHRLDGLMGIRDKESESYSGYYDFVYRIFDTRFKTMNNTHYI